MMLAYTKAMLCMSLVKIDRQVFDILSRYLFLELRHHGMRATAGEPALTHCPLTRGIYRGESGAGKVATAGRHSLTSWVAGSLRKSAVVRAERDSDGGRASTHTLAARSLARSLGESTVVRAERGR